MSRLSVRFRATLAATVIVAAALGIAAAVLTGVLRGSLLESVSNEAARRADAAADVLVTGDPAAGVYHVADPDVEVLADRTAPATPGPRLDQVPPPGAAPDDWAPAGSFTLAEVPVTTSRGEMTVRARASLEPAGAALRTLRNVLIPGVPALLLLVAALTWLAVGRALAPVSAIRAEVADITAGDLHRRVPVPRSRDEIARLAETMNRTLDRLEAAVGRHRRFVADAAHELRSPLAVLRTRLELAWAEPTAAEALADVDRLQRLTSDLLLLARLDAGEPPCHEEVDLGQVAAEEAARSRPRPEIRVGIEVAADVVVRGSAEQLRRLVANLVDNAVRHATSTVTVRLALERTLEGAEKDTEEGEGDREGEGSAGESTRGGMKENTRKGTKGDGEGGPRSGTARGPKGGAARGTAKGAGKSPGRVRAVLDVRDDGPGIPAEHHAAVFDRFTRLDEARDRDAGGSGLGLAIARDIAIRHSGTLDIVLQTTGAHLRARLPVMGTPQAVVKQPPGGPVVSLDAKPGERVGEQRAHRPRPL